jgi:LmbE family N-acetylglucosaminyl deacetylase
MNKILYIGAHPDDVELGCAGTMARFKAEGKKVRVFVYGKGRGDKLDQRFDTIPLLEITQTIEKEIALFKPDTVFTHNEEDLNKDHRTIYQATLTACRPMPEFCVKEIYSYEVVSSSEWRCTQGIMVDTWIDITPYMEDKIELLKDWYDEEMREWPHPRSYEGVKVLAKYRGMQVGVPFAEGFRCIRRVL